MRQHVVESSAGNLWGRLGRAVALSAALAVAGCCTVSPLPGADTAQAAYVDQLGDQLQYMRERQMAGAFRAKVEESFDTLGDRDMAMHLWLRVAECETQRSTPALAQAIYQYALDIYRVQGGDPDLLLIETRSDARSVAPALADQWLTTLRAMY